MLSTNNLILKFFKILLKSYADINFALLSLNVKYFGILNKLFLPQLIHLSLNFAFISLTV